jgi:hypothetical protein
LEGIEGEELECAIDDLSEGNNVVTWVLNNVAKVQEGLTYGYVIGEMQEELTIGVGSDKNTALANWATIANDMDDNAGWPAVE